MTAAQWLCAGAMLVYVVAVAAAFVCTLLDVLAGFRSRKEDKDGSR